MSDKDKEEMPDAINDANQQTQKSTTTATPMETDTQKKPKGFKESSYYYAWKDYKEPDQQHVAPLRVEKVQPKKLIKTVDKYVWYDDAKKVKIIVELDSIGAVPTENHKVDFQSHRLTWTVDNYQDRTWKLDLFELSSRVLPDKCKFVVKPNKIVFTLAKKRETRQWYSLTSENPYRDESDTETKENAEDSDEEMPAAKKDETVVEEDEDAMPELEKVSNDVLK